MKQVGSMVDGRSNGSDREGLKRARAEAERILNAALRSYAPDFFGSFKFTAQKGKIVSRQVVESELPVDGS